MAGYKIRLKRSWKFIVAIVIPLVLLPVFFVTDDEMIPDDSYGKSANVQTEDVIIEGEVPMKKSPKFKLAYVILVMAVYWALEILPLPITSLFPLVMFPLFGIDDAANVSKSYMKESNTIFLGGAIVALAVEFCNLHRRVALYLITIVGVSPRRLMFGIMAVVSFLSMWISNTTCTTMLIPIIVAIVDEIHEVTEATNDVDGNPSTVNIHSRRPSNMQPSVNEERARSQPVTPAPRRTSAFANAALSSRHSPHANRPGAEDDDRRGAFGILESHRHNSRANDRGNPIVTVTPTPNQLQCPVENNNNDIFTHEQSNTKPRPRQLSLVIGQVESERIPASDRRASSLSANVVNNRRYSFENQSQSRNSICSIAEPGRIEIFMNLPSPTLAECVDETERRKQLEKEKWRNIKNMYLFALAYSANIGGTATITGTGPNKVFKEVIKPYSNDIYQDGKYLKMTFFTWLAFNLPSMLVNNFVAWIYLTIKYCGFPKFSSKNPQQKEENAVRRWKEQHVRSYLREEYKKLGKMSFHEIGVATVFLLVVFLWILRDPQIFPGWHDVTSDGLTGDSTSALLGAVLLFIIPRNWAFLTSKEGVQFEALLDWSFVTKKLPWGVLLLLGSGYAIGDEVVRTGLSEWIGKELYLLHNLPEPLLLLIVMIITAFITEVVSNTACTSIILPVLLGISREMGLHPLYLSVPAAVTASYAFMLPVASPVNAIVFAAGDFSIWEMITNGYILNAICVLTFYINTLTLGECMFDYSEFSYPTDETSTSEWPENNTSTLGF